MVPVPRPALGSCSRGEQSHVEQPCCSPWRKAIFVLSFAEWWCWEQLRKPEKQSSSGWKPCKAELGLELTWKHIFAS